jgi:hypothetical protein
MLVGKDWKDFQSCFSSIFGENFSVLLLTFLPMNQRIIDGTFGQRLENIQGYDHVVRFLILLGTYEPFIWKLLTRLRGKTPPRLGHLAPASEVDGGHFLKWHGLPHDHSPEPENFFDTNHFTPE